MICLIPLFISTSEITNAKNKKSTLEKKKKEIQESLNRLEEKKSSIVEYIAELDKQLADIENSIEDLNYKITTTKTNLEKTKVELQKAQAKEAKQYETMKARIRQMYVSGNDEFIQIILSSESLSDFLNRSEYVKQISKYDNNMFNEFKKIKEDKLSLTLSGMEKCTFDFSANPVITSIPDDFDGFPMIGGVKNVNLSAKNASNSSILTRTCSMLSRKRTVTQPSFSDSKS